MLTDKALSWSYLGQFCGLSSQSPQTALPAVLCTQHHAIDPLWSFWIAEKVLSIDFSRRDLAQYSPRFRSQLVVLMMLRSADGGGGGGGNLLSDNMGHQMFRKLLDALASTAREECRVNAELAANFIESSQEVEEVPLASCTAQESCPVSFKDDVCMKLSPVVPCFCEANEADRWARIHQTGWIRVMPGE